MTIKGLESSKFFTKFDVDFLKLLGYKDIEVDTFDHHRTEEICLGDGVFLVGTVADCGHEWKCPKYFVSDRECHEACLSERDVMSAMLNYKHDAYVNSSLDDGCVPDYFRPWEFSALFGGVHTKNADGKEGVVQAKRWQKFTTDLGYAVVFSENGRRVKIAKNKFDTDDVLPKSLPAYSKWETVKDGDGEPLTASLGKIFEFGSMSTAERTRELNLIIKGLVKRLNGR